MRGMTTFTQSRHVSVARRFLDKSAREFTDGDSLNGAELLCGAAAHALIAVALDHAWNYDSRGALKNVVRQLAALHHRPQWFSDFDTAERFHAHFYHGRLTDAQITADRPKVARFVNRLLSRLMLQ